MIEKPTFLAYSLDLPFPKLIELSENVNKYYRVKRDVKENSDGTNKIKNGEIQYRIMNPSTGKLKRIQNLILKRILRKISLPDYVIGGVPGKSHIINAKRHLGKKYKFKTDIKDYYPSITSKQVYNAFIKASFSPDVSRILTMLTTYKGYLPQGTPTSTDISNIVFLLIDEELDVFCKANGITYTRYIDDLVFSSQKDFKTKTEEILEIIENHGFKRSHRKTKYKIGNFTITGIITGNNILRPRISQINKLMNPLLSKIQKNGLKTYFKQLR